MNKFLKRILLGLIIWAVPLITSLFVWNVEANAPKVSMAWFNALMAFTWAIGFSVAALLWFRDNKDGVKTGVIWYLELVILDLIVLVGLFGMSITDFYPMLLTYLNSVVICAAIGYAK